MLTLGTCPFARCVCVQAEEIKRIKKAMRKSNNKAKTGSLQRALTKVQQGLATRKREDKVREKLSDVRRQERAAIEQGKQPFYLSRKAKADLVKEVRVDELKHKGGVEKLAAKKAKRQKLRQKIAVRRKGGNARGPTSGPRLGV